MTELPNGQTIGTVERAADVLALFASTDEPTLGVTEIARSLGLSKAVVHRILSSLRVRDFVAIDPDSRRYSLGPGALALGLTYLKHVDVRGLSRGVLAELSGRLNETATLSILTGWSRIYIEQVTPPREVKMTVPIGTAFPLHAGSSSKALLAFMSTERIDEYLSSADLEPLTDLTFTSSDQLREELAKIRERGYASSFGERQEGAASVAAPILDHEDHPVASISLCGPVDRFRAEVPDAARMVLAAAADISRQLGHRGQDQSIPVGRLT